MKILKLILPAILIVVILIIYFTYFASTDEIGSFSKFSLGSEINQDINVAVVKDNGFERDTIGNINSFFAKDKNGVEVQLSSHQPISEEIAKAEVVELLDHLHEKSLTTSKITVIK